MGTIGAIAMTGLNVAMAKYTGKKVAHPRLPVRLWLGLLLVWPASSPRPLLLASVSALSSRPLMYKTDEEYEAYLRFMGDDPMYHGEDDDDDDEEFDSDVHEVETNLHHFEDMCKHMHPVLLRTHGLCP